ncbi:hypothetical protein EhV334 [Emiliania huxleyi virus 86]|uniref:Uncharacterized protein n=1 Tax=Emiliania huxleyi virus 86 (isolate United Kingdom/English Channel/1999) TaxID=654925 RepID=Q4A2E5_EHV8U|nr:hypothetical protein EhV334 [Emiliania huxleyi virus 86]AEO97783.1 hypothetical protein ENVG_00250 [Emiliania huxleyi virus 84]AEO98445.1 hypothetical protein ELVG_00144 [Emiliania huxleyi virus 203]AEP15261.1 hypothetical protein EOVG_00324 [Emiliania huxleyi virus 88]AEP15551.1 hypothetical protein EQVG_00141 [Emiliania huxleyi virus 207]AEP15971.1 hypothetical protein ERVG_00094 [Emiliania huxleyi virus 208]AET98047.1 hypothetical protein EPVG_00159 [Emiliania huxleyi virus 201]AHA5494|mmetsp:Transcript_8085/g.23967  ORF Transcript_8085/g.23967 Transcript_8085/m.23967 type:complete len:141 (+) Transcript_8085:1448-1870(+)
MANVTLINKLEVLHAKLDIVVSSYTTKGEKISALSELKDYNAILMFQKNQNDAAIYAQGGITLIKMMKNMTNVNKHTIAHLKDSVESKFFHTLLLLDKDAGAYIKMPQIYDKDIVFPSPDLLTYYLGVKNTLSLIEPCIV